MCFEMADDIVGLKNGQKSVIRSRIRVVTQSRQESSCPEAASCCLKVALLLYLFNSGQLLQRCHDVHLFSYEKQFEYTKSYSER